MERTIYKYTLRIDDEQEVEMPVGAEILTVQMQNGRPCLWALVRPDNPKKPRKISIRGTGHSANNLGRYISTFQMHGGDLVFHAFEAIPNLSDAEIGESK